MFSWNAMYKQPFVRLWNVTPDFCSGTYLTKVVKVWFDKNIHLIKALKAAGSMEKQGKCEQEITIAAYVYVFIVKKLKDNIKNSKYCETVYQKKGEPCWRYIAHLSARAHTYTHI